MKQRVKHYLLTLYIGPHQHLHAYVMTADPRSVTGVINDMLRIAEAAGPLAFPAILQTTLDSGTDTVRQIVGSLDPKAQQLMAEATDFHYSVFAMTADHPDDSRLMELH